ncbi:oxygenase MpaB family protein [Dactylosporangium sp. AC04546]|uniref:oxygenase MpaB family protein n=1 Tax=Dactylosporangium sp. AC04546 TaxID=2862460 RepID=UPI001EDE3AC6|nr:oxygenase MpaB family protein [Dactylosporangium sp. AC04546]UFE15763.1 latex clearing protein [Dactylosporangium sp. AC04546]WVK78999.1 oxygenase MpaB family protein [Dactylosporangium sp. AC04546]
MERLSRRNVLVAGGALGALGALGVATPAWTWAPSGSVAGAGAGLDPRWVWDDEADPLVASLIDRGDVPRVNALLRTWTKNGQALPAGLPADLRDFMEHARQLPAWTDQRKLSLAVEFNTKRGLYLGVLYGLASGMMSTVIPKEARAVYYSQGGADMKDRISKTAKLGYDIGAYNAYQPDGEMIVTCVKTRLVHAAVRHLLPQSPYWAAVADEEIPISQRDMMVTWHSLPTTVMQKLTAWKVPIPAAESEAFLHSWQLGAHMLGIKDEYIPASWSEANAQAAQVLTPVLAPTPEGIKLADILLNLGSVVDAGILSKPILGAFTRFMLGDQIAGWLKIDREPVWDTLLRTAWGPFVAVREGLLPFPLAPAAYWLFDEFLRKAALLFLSEARPISIEIPVANRPS